MTGLMPLDFKVELVPFLISHFREYKVIVEPTELSQHWLYDTNQPQVLGRHPKWSVALRTSSLVKSWPELLISNMKWKLHGIWEQVSGQRKKQDRWLHLRRMLLAPGHHDLGSSLPGKKLSFKRSVVALLDLYMLSLFGGGILETHLEQCYFFV